MKSSKTTPRLRYLRQAKTLPKPPRDAIINLAGKGVASLWNGPSRRMRLRRDLNQYLYHGKSIADYRRWRNVRALLAALGALVAVIIFNFYFTQRSFDELESFDFVVFSIISLFGAIIFLGFIWVLTLPIKMNNNPWPDYADQPPGHRHPVFDRNRAGEIAKRGYDALENCGADKDAILEELRLFSRDRDIPFRVIKGLAPLKNGFPARPLGFETNKRILRSSADVNHSLLLADAVCGGALWALGAKPDRRFVTLHDEDDELVADRYWQADAQELPDNFHGDVFLRFHQSTIEKDFSNTCRYKTLSCISNFRGAPLLLVTVQDVVACLENSNEEFSEEEHKQLFFSDEEAKVTKENIIKTLSDTLYEFMPPRSERIKDDDTEAKGPRAILTDLNRDNPGSAPDYVMSFDPARVWAHENHRGRLAMEAVVVLRRAVHWVSRKKATEINLKWRDVLVVDNLRALIARAEDKPGFASGFIDAFSSFFEARQGRWLRQIYGFPKSNQRGVRNIAGAAMQEKNDDGFAPLNTVQPLIAQAEKLEGRQDEEND
ncbi:MAG: hypothetical protein AAFX54_07230 [Pseudomonadota bacterium]